MTGTVIEALRDFWRRLRAHRARRRAIAKLVALSVCPRRGQAFSGHRRVTR